MWTWGRLAVQGCFERGHSSEKGRVLSRGGGNAANPPVSPSSGRARKMPRTPELGKRRIGEMAPEKATRNKPGFCHQNAPRWQNAPFFRAPLGAAHIRTGRVRCEPAHIEEMVGIAANSNQFEVSGFGCCVSGVRSPPRPSARRPRRRSGCR